MQEKSPWFIQLSDNRRALPPTLTIAHQQVRADPRDCSHRRISEPVRVDRTNSALIVPAPAESEGFGVPSAASLEVSEGEDKQALPYEYCGLTIK